MRLPARATPGPQKRFPVDVAVVDTVGGRVLLVAEAKLDGQRLSPRQRMNYARCGVPAVLVTERTLSFAAYSIAAYFKRGDPLPEDLLIRIANRTGVEREEKARATTESAKRTWLTPYGEAWREAMGDDSEIPWGRLAGTMQPLERHHGQIEVLLRFRRYLRDAGKYASPTRFAQTFGLWKHDDPRRRDPLDQRPGEDIDAYMRRLASR